MSDKPTIKRNKRGWIVVNNGKSNVSNPDGRPPRVREMYMQHLNQFYKGKKFSSYNLLASMHKELDNNTNLSPKIVQVGKMLRNLEKRGVIRCTGIMDNNQRGNNVKMYKLI